MKEISVKSCQAVSGGCGFGGCLNAFACMLGVGVMVAVIVGMGAIYIYDYFTNET